MNPKAGLTILLQGGFQKGLDGGVWLTQLVEHATFHLRVMSSSPMEGINLSLKIDRGAWVAQLVKYPTSAQVMISQVMGLSPASGSVLTAQSPEPASDSVSPSLSAPPLLVLSLGLSFSLSQI